MFRSLLASIPLLITLAAQAVPPVNLAAALMDDSRPAEDKARDDGRKPAEVLQFLGVQPGMVAMDVMAACYAIPETTTANLYLTLQCAGRLTDS